MRNAAKTIFAALTLACNPGGSFAEYSQCAKSILPLSSPRMLLPSYQRLLVLPGPSVPEGPKHSRAQRQLRLRGGAPSEQSAIVEKWAALSGWMSARWDEIPAEHKSQLHEFTLGLVRDQVLLNITNPHV